MGDYLRIIQVITVSDSNYFDRGDITYLVLKAKSFFPSFLIKGVSLDSKNHDFNK